ncbi:MAG: hypothetical protein GX275_14210 [Clostridiales bacterium]|nr:hypothetical protein [Clostridiales bacterium]
MRRGKNKIILALFVILIFVNVALPTSAKENSELQLNVTTEKEVYEQKDEIKYSIKLDNNYRSDVTDISVKAIIPKGLKVLDTQGEITEENVIWQVNSIKAGELVELEITLKMEEKQSDHIIVDVDVDKPVEGKEGNNKSSESDNMPITSDANTMIKTGIVMLLVVGSTVFLMKTKKGKKIISIFIVSTFMGGLVFGNATPVKAKIIDINTSKEKTITISEEDYTVNVEVTGKCQLADEEENDDGFQRAKSWEDMIDTDGDGLPDDYESEIGTDLNNPDTDGDGLSDGYEVLHSSTNPLKISTLDNGVSDADLDTDEDGLTTIKEFQLGTDPLVVDTDGDGLSDGEEVTIHNTDPLVTDTDKDTVLDGDEILIGLDPLNPKTFSYPDKEYKSTQKVNAENKLLEEINKDNDDYKLSLEFEAQGSVYSNLIVRESAYSSILKNDSILGIAPEIISTNKDNNISTVKLKFSISDINIHEKYSTEDLKGVRRYNVFWYNEEEGLLMPITTEVDEVNNTLIADVEKVGTYCLVDMEKWLSNLGYEIADNNQFQSKTFSMENKDILQEKVEASAKSDASYSSVNRLMNKNAIMNPEEESKDKIDVIFNLNNNVKGLTLSEFQSIKTNIELIGKALFYETKDVRIYVLDQNGNVVETSFGQEYASNTTQLSSMIQKLLNTPPQTPYIDKQVNTMINTLPLRADAFKTSIFIGNAYMSSETNSLIQKVADANIHCCIAEPATQVGSWYDRLSKESKGLLIYSYIDFTEEVLEFIYGYLPNVPMYKYKMITSAGLKLIVLNAELNSRGITDTDGDGLTDWEEVDQKKVTVNGDGSVNLPTYIEYLEMTKFGSLFNNYNLSRYNNIYEINGKNLMEILSEIYVLPIKSDPTLKDSDEDGILDIDESKWDGVDERYKNIGPLHKDTVETLFPEIKNNEENKSSYPSYVTIKDNDVTLHVEIVFKEDANKIASTSLKTTNLSANHQTEMDNIINKLGNQITFKELIMDGIRSRFEGNYTGNEYDFYKDLKVNFNVEISENTSSITWLQKTITVNVKDGVCGVCNQSGVDWKTNCNRVVTMYSSYCKESGHKNKKSSACSKYSGSLYSLGQYEGTSAHEFGHVFGLKDLYGSASVNHGYEPLSNAEIIYSNLDFGLPQSNGLMRNNGNACANDIEMILLAFSENTWQYYVPSGKDQVMSKAIKSNVIFRNEADQKNYVWNSSTYKFE